MRGAGFEDTIAAIATPPGEGGIGIVRLSGPRAEAVAGMVFRPRRGGSLAGAAGYTARLGHVVDGDGRIVDEAIALVMRRPRSFTGEDTVELSCHGGPVVLRTLLELCLRNGARLAEPGEFTRRAFINGRIDLAQAEAVLDVIRAKTGLAARLAVDQLGGRLSGRVRQLRDLLAGLVAHLETNIDFPELDIEALTGERVLAGVREALEEVSALLAGANAGKILRQGLRTAIIGRPNVGKSSLLNALLRENRAIVTEVPGTTRDVIEEYVNVRGVPVVLVDTAGIRRAGDRVEMIGIERTWLAVREADLVLLVVDDSAGLVAEDVELLKEIRAGVTIVVVNKIDLGCYRIHDEDVRSVDPDATVARVSALSGEGLAGLEEGIVARVLGGEAAPEREATVSNVRHQDALERTKGALLDVMRTLEGGHPLDLVAPDLRAAWEALGEITGETVSADLLDEIFSRFCIGK